MDSEDETTASILSRDSPVCTNAVDNSSNQQSSATAVAESDVVTRPAKRKKSTAVVSVKPHNIYALTDEHGQFRYIGSTAKDKVRAASLGVGAPMLKLWILKVAANDPDWNWTQHTKILARNVPAHRVCAFKTMLMSDHGTFWSEGNGMCNLHGQSVAGIEHQFPAMREEIESDFASTSVNALQAAEIDADIMADIDDDTRDDTGSIPIIHNALIERQEYLQALRGSPFEQAVKMLVDKYHKGGFDRTNEIKLEQFITDINTLYDDHNSYVWSSHLEESMHEEAMSILKRLRVYTGMGTTTPDTPMTYNFVHERLKLLMNAVKHRDNINGQSFQSQMAWTQPTFKLKPSKLPQGYEAAIGHAENTLEKCEDLTAWQRKQMKARLQLLERMKNNDEPIKSCPILNH